VKPELAIIVAMDEDRGIGKGGGLPWHIPADLRHFRELTIPYPVIMGRKTFESILTSLKKPLPKRPNIVISRNPEFSYPDTESATSIAEALGIAGRYSQEKIFVIGGAQIFAQALPFVDKLYLTLVKGKYETDAFFPEYDVFNQIISEEAGRSDGYEYRFLELIKKHEG
jgi:dihydrofolate reductase